MTKYLFAAALGLLTLSGCSKKDGPVVDPALITLVPADTTTLLDVRVEDLMKTPVYQKHLAQQAIPPLDNFAKEFGVDPRKDLWELLFISNGQQTAILGRGRFSNEAEPRIEREAKGGVRSNYRGFTFIGDDASSVLLMGPTVMGIGDTALLKQVVDTRDKTNGPPAILAERMKEIPKGVALWTVFLGFPLQQPDASNVNVATAAKLFQLMQSGSFYLDLRTAVSGKLTAVAANEADAKELQGAARGLLGLARLATPSKAASYAKMQKLYDGMRVTQEGLNVNVYIEESEESVSTVMDMLLGLTQGRGKANPAPKQ